MYLGQDLAGVAIAIVPGCTQGSIHQDMTRTDLDSWTLVELPCVPQKYDYAIL